MLPPSAANDFSCALRGTFAFTVEPGEKGTSPNFREAPPAASANVEITFTVTKIWPAMSNLFKDFRGYHCKVVAFREFVEARRRLASAR